MFILKKPRHLKWLSNFGQQRSEKLAIGRCTALILAGLMLASCAKNVGTPTKNLDPKVRFTVIAMTDGLPASSSVLASAHYYVKNQKCIATDYTKALGGTRVGAVQQESLRVSASGEGAYSVDAFDDIYIPSVLSAGHEPCEFSLVAVTFTFDIDGIVRTTSISRSDIEDNSVQRAECGYSDRAAAVDVCLTRADASAGKHTFTVTTKRI